MEGLRVTSLGRKSSETREKQFGLKHPQPDLPHTHTPTPGNCESPSGNTRQESIGSHLVQAHTQPPGMRSWPHSPATGHGGAADEIPKPAMLEGW